MLPPEKSTGKISDASIGVIPALVIAALLLSPMLFAGFYGDDFLLWHEGRRLLEDPSKLLIGPSNFYRPANSWLFAAHHLAFGTDPVGYHVVTLLMHLTAGALLGLLVVAAIAVHFVRTVFAEHDVAAEDHVGGPCSYATGPGRKVENKLHTLIGCKHKDGHRFQCNGVINPIDVMGQTGHAIALNTLIGEAHTLSGQSEQRLEAVEQSLFSVLQFARSNPSLMLDLGNIVDLSADGKDALTDKALIREQAVHVMNLALACWERQLGRSKLDLAEESGLWPVYIDKSTPTTRTLDKYLNLELCPKNPRSKRVIDTAEFVLRKVDDQSSSECQQLQSELDSFRKRVSGISKQAPKSV